jgi:hypothetical protein
LQYIARPAKSRAKVGDLAIPSEHLRLQHVSDHYKN